MSFIYLLTCFKASVLSFAVWPFTKVPPSACLTNLSKASTMDSSICETESEFLNAVETLKEVSTSLRNYSSSLENDTERINQIQERLFLLDKFGFCLCIYQ